jgi:hypothetical protein
MDVESSLIERGIRIDPLRAVVEQHLDSFALLELILCLEEHGITITDPAKTFRRTLREIINDDK